MAPEAQTKDNYEREAEDSRQNSSSETVTSSEKILRHSFERERTPDSAQAKSETPNLVNDDDAEYEINKQRALVVADGTAQAEKSSENGGKQLSEGLQQAVEDLP